MLKQISAPLAQQPITSLARISDNQFVSGADDGILQVWNVVDDEATATITYKNSEISAAIKFLQVLSEDGEGGVRKNWVVIGYASGSIEVLDITAKVPVCLSVFQNCKSGLINLVLMSGGRLIAGYADGSIHLWNLNLIKVVSSGCMPSIWKLRDARGKLIENITAFTALDDQFSAADHAGNCYVWQLPNSSSAIIDLHTITHVVTMKSKESEAIASLMLLSRSNLHVLSIGARGLMKHWKVKAKLTGGFVATLDATTKLDESTAYFLVNAQSFPKWFTVSNRSVQEWHLPVKITPQSQVSAAAEISLPSAQNDSVLTKPSFTTWIKRQAANVVERRTDSLRGACTSIDEAGVQACAFLSENCLVVAAGVQGFYLWWPEKAPALSEERRLVARSMPCVEVGEMLEVLGRGSFGRVYKANLMPDNNIAIAVKEVSLLDELGLKKEIELHIQLSHSNVLSLYGIFGNDIQYSLVCELMTGGTLSTLLHHSQIELSWEARCQIALDAAAAVFYLHSLNIFHGDIKSENFLVNHSGRIKLADFGTARVMTGEPIHVGSLVGTLLYMAPELLELFLGDRQSVVGLKELDVYAFAIVLWEIMMRQGLPYPMNAEKAEQILASKIELDNERHKLIKQVVELWRDENEKLELIDTSIATLKAKGALSEDQEEELSVLMSQRRGISQTRDSWYQSYVQQFVVSGQRPEVDEAMLAGQGKLIRAGWSQDPASRPSIGVIYEGLKQQMAFFQQQKVNKSKLIEQVKSKIGQPKG